MKLMDTNILTLMKTKKNKDNQIKIRDLIRSITKLSNDYDKKYMIIKFNFDDELALNKNMKTPTTKIVLRAIFYENKKVFLDEYLYKI